MATTTPHRIHLASRLPVRLAVALQDRTPSALHPRKPCSVANASRSSPQFALHRTKVAWRTGSTDSERAFRRLQYLPSIRSTQAWLVGRFHLAHTETPKIIVFRSGEYSYRIQTSWEMRNAKYNSAKIQVSKDEKVISHFECKPMASLGRDDEGLPPRPG